MSDLWPLIVALSLSLFAAGAMVAIFRQRSRLKISRRSASYLRAVGKAERQAPKPDRPQSIAPMPAPVAPAPPAPVTPDFAEPAPLEAYAVEADMVETAPPETAPIEIEPPKPAPAPIMPPEIEEAADDSLFDAPARTVPVHDKLPVARKPAKPKARKAKSAKSKSSFRVDFSGLKSALNRWLVLPKTYERGLVMLYTPPEKVAPSATPEFLLPWFIAQSRGISNAPAFKALSDNEIRIVELLHNSMNSGDRAYAGIREAASSLERELLDQTRPMMTGNASAVLQDIRNQDGLNSRLHKLVAR